MKRALIATLLIVVAAPLAAQQFSSARPGGDRIAADLGFLGEDLGFVTDKGTAPEHAKRMVIEFLQLTEEQIAAWTTLLELRRTDAEAIREQIQAINEELRGLFEAGDPDPTAVGELVIASRGLHGQMGEVNRAYVDGFEALLDERQAQRLSLVRRAAHMQPVIPAFRALGLLPPR